MNVSLGVFRLRCSLLELSLGEGGKKNTQHLTSKPPRGRPAYPRPKRVALAGC